MKKLLAALSGIMLLSCLTSCASASGAQGGQEANNPVSMIMMVVFYVVILGAMYFLFIRPSSKKKKEEEQMRESLEIGDEIITIGGITGRVVNIKEDGAFIMETGPDRTKILFQQWALSSIVTEKNLNEAKNDKKDKKKKEKAEEK